MLGVRNIVYQENGEPLELTRRLGAGGQGEVWAAGRRHAVKVLRPKDQVNAARLHRRLQMVKRLDLDGLPLSRPLAMLRPPDLGYVMELLDDMVALETLSAAPFDSAAFLTWYGRTGGLRRRLRVLARLAGALSALHARGMVYGDPSPANVVVSEPVEHEEVWLIDVDNIAVTSEVREEQFMTRGYAAPELVGGRRGVTSLSDAYAFAVMAFQTLAVTHPFVGDVVHDGDPELEARAYAGELPWIHHPDDDTNRSGFGIDWELVLTPALRTLAARTFVDGLHDPVWRPTVGEWRTKLYEAADMTLLCACGGSFYASLTACPWCRAGAPPALVATVHTHVPDLASTDGYRLAALVLQQEEQVEVTARTAILDQQRPERPIAVLRWERTGALVTTNRWDRPLWFIAPGGGAALPVEPAAEYRFPGPEAMPGWELHFGPPGEPHRLLRLTRMSRGGRG
jgi:DNA-binding helix-hairpin-helix protein with protein kinase domain